jgi:uncharacterized repeat protein (TIGR03837 family)
MGRRHCAIVRALPENSKASRQNLKINNRADNLKMNISATGPTSAVNQAHLQGQGLLWDVFCRVIDNFGDIGVCWRLCADLAGRGQRVRLWLDDGSALEWMAPGALEGQHANITVHPWLETMDSQALEDLEPANVWIEAFGCEIEPVFISCYRQHTGTTPVWINLEYLSAEPFVERSHTLPSPVMSGPAKGWTKYFYYPGFTEKTGGLLREPWIKDRQALRSEASKAAWLQKFGITWQGEKLISLFCYAAAPVTALLESLENFGEPVRLLVTKGQAKTAVQKVQRERNQPRSFDISFLPLVSQTDYDQLLGACDLNFVRGEDSLVRALWAGKPLVWQIYPQEDGAHHAKLHAFLDQMEAPASLHQWHQSWNGLTRQDSLQTLKSPLLAEWQSTAEAFRGRLTSQPDLTQQLIEFVTDKGEAVKKR